MAGRQFFSESEKTCLQELIVKYKLNSRETSGPGNPAVKKMAWARLAQEFNSIETNTKRTESQLKKCWDNMKTRRKQVLAEEKRQRLRTGGGPFQGSSQEASCEDMLQDAVDLELTYAIDSDTLEGNQANYSQPSTSQGNNSQPSTSTASQPSCSQQIVQSLIETDVNIENVSFACNLPTSVDSSGPNRESIEYEAINLPTSAESVRPTRRSTDNMAEREATHRSGSQLSNYSAGSAQTPGTATARNVRANVIAEEFAIRQESYQLTRKRDDELHKLKLKEREFLVLAAEETYKKSKLERESAEEILKCSKAKREEAELHLLILKNKRNIQ